MIIAILILTHSLAATIGVLSGKLLIRTDCSHCEHLLDEADDERAARVWPAASYWSGLKDRDDGGDR